ncbi:unnamed protein product [Rotaria sordida]|uniref:Uncharacterized protein n=1 Tax=Rotaria sordida TaxID=392033 RepID=A0A813XGP6_9BILA|nr:unnamed protein product [Rotaria sordida]
MDIRGWRSQQNETYMIQYKPKGAEAHLPASQSYTMFNFNLDYPEPTKRYDSPDICDLKRSGIGKVPCLSYFETQDRPVKTIRARTACGDYDSDEYISTVYLLFTHGIPSEAEHLFDFPDQWPSYCGNENTGFTIEPYHGFVVYSLGDQVKVAFKVQPNWYYNSTQCAKFNTIVFDTENWQEPQQVDMSFGDYGCCTYRITANGGEYNW